MNTVLERAGELLSSTQIEVMLGEGNRLVTACPGAGKTRSIGARAALLSERHSKVALTTYTNVAADEMRVALVRDYGMSLGEEHFVGTLHQLLLRYVFRPYAHLVMGCEVPPNVRIERLDDTIEVESFTLRVDDFRLKIDGTADYVGERPPDCYITTANLGIFGAPEAREHKRDQARLGAVTADDALYWCYETLRQVPEAGTAVAARFDELIVDEAQDTSSYQVECLRLLVEAGLPSLFLIGDFDQSIYSFQGADPSLCRALASEVGLVTKSLNENWRSSQLICNTTAWFRASKAPDRAVGESAAFPVRPSLVLYEPGAVADLADDFSRYLVESGVSTERSAVVARRLEFAAEIDGRSTPKRLPTAVQLLFRCIRARESALALTDIRDVENLLLGFIHGEASGLGEFERNEVVRDAAMKAIFGLPALEGDLGSWLDGASEVLQQSVTMIDEDVSTEERVAGRLHVGKQTRNLGAAEMVRPARVDGMAVGSVHSVKGKSLGGVMVVAEHSPAWSGARLQVDTWVALLRQQADSGGSGQANEELRIVYVALTRAEKICRLALPAAASEDSIAAFVAAGFEFVSG